MMYNDLSHATITTITVSVIPRGRCSEQVHVVISPRTYAHFFSMLCRSLERRMIKRKCGTCKHFEDRDIAGSGWCTHPARQDIKYMVLVRKSELACRNFMDQALWEPAENATDLADLPDAVIPDPAIIPGELAPDIAMEASNRGRSSTVPNDHTDQITSITMPVNPERPATKPVSFGADRISAPAIDGGSAVRDAQRRRREEHARQHKAPDTILPEPAMLLDKLADPTGPAVVPDAGKSGVSRGAPRFILPPDEQDDPLLVAPPRSGSRAPLTPPITPTTIPKRTSLTFQSDGDVELDKPLPEQPPGRQPTPARAATGDGSTEPFELVEPAHPVVTSNVDVPSAQVRRHGRTPQTAAQLPNADRPETPPASSSQRANSAPESRPAENRARSAQTSPLAIDPINEHPRAKDLPHCCGSCRDFIPEGDGTSGRCKNAYALATPHMVKSDELACRSSIGVWWLPRDDAWLERADNVSAARPDALLPGLAHSLAAERSGLGTQRRGEL